VLLIGHWSSTKPEVAMSIPSPTELLAFLEEHAFLTSAEVRQLGTSLSQFADSESLARVLIEQNCLTAYQANLLLQGQGEELVLGPYRILDQLGEGGMGQVLEAHHTSMDRIVALKVITRSRLSNPTALARFQREVRAVAKLSHPNIVTAFDVSQVGDTHFLSMEHVGGIDLAKLVQQSGPLPIPTACEYIRQAAVGLQHAHEEGLVHRDIKPGNLMVARPEASGPPVIKILDFGLARFESETIHAGRLTQLGKLVGTVDYIAPEQAQDARTADIRADIYSLGCSLFYLLTGKPPFSGSDAVQRISARVLGEAPLLRQVRPEVSPALERVVARMMARQPADRYQTPGEVARALEPHTARESPAPFTPGQTPGEVAQMLRQAPATPPAPPPAPPVGPVVALILRPVGTGRRRSNHPPVVGVVAAVTLLAVLVGVLVFVASKGTSEPGGPAGFVPLFNGKDLEGWQIHNGKLESWGADKEKGILYVQGGGGGWLMTDKEYGDFELRLEFKVPKGGDSGVALRAPLEGAPTFQGMEIQILDDTSYPGHQVWHHTGAIYEMVPPTRVVTRPVGQWNKYHIVCKGRRVTVELNGTKVVDADLDKYKEKHSQGHPGILREKGHIGLQEHNVPGRHPAALQEHGGRVEFRKIEVKELPRSERRGQ
jgi:serine/threonine-protein kinase